MRNDKLRDMIRSILPSTYRRYARMAKAGRKRALRHAIHVEVRVEDHEETAADLLRDVRVNDIVRDRRSGDKLHHFMRWCEAITEGMSTQEALEYVRAILPKSLIGDHAYGHWRTYCKRRRFRESFVPYAEQNRRQEQSSRDSAIFRLRRALRADPELHTRLNAEIKRRTLLDEPRRLLMGLHDIEAFIDDAGCVETRVLMELIEEVERAASGPPLLLDIEVVNDAVVDVVDPAMHGQRLAARPRIAHDGRAGNVHHLLNDVQFAQSVVLPLFALQRIDFRLDVSCARPARGAASCRSIPICRRVMPRARRRSHSGRRR